MISNDQVKLYAQLAGIVLLFLLAIVFVVNVGRFEEKKDSFPQIIIQVDTLYLHDTIHIEKPVPAIVRTIDTFLIAVTDTIRIQDTMYISLPREQKIYHEENFRAWISGYRPVLDSIHIFQNTQQVITSTTIHQNQKPRRWGIGIQAGYGLTYEQNTFKPAPYIGIGVSYHLLVF